MASPFSWCRAPHCRNGFVAVVEVKCTDCKTWCFWSDFSMIFPFFPILNFAPNDICIATMAYVPPGCWLPSPGGTASGACLWHLMAKHSSTGQAQKHRTNPLQASVIFILFIHMEYCITTYHYVSLYYPLHYTTIMYSI